MSFKNTLFALLYLFAATQVLADNRVVNEQATNKTVDVKKGIALRPTTDGGVCKSINPPSSCTTMIKKGDDEKKTSPTNYKGSAVSKPNWGVDAPAQAPACNSSRGGCLFQSGYK